MRRFLTRLDGWRHAFEQSRDGRFPFCRCCLGTAYNNLPALDSASIDWTQNLYWALHFGLCGWSHGGSITNRLR